MDAQVLRGAPACEQEGKELWSMTVQTLTAPNALCCCSVTEVVVSSAPWENEGKITYLRNCWQALPKQLP